MNKTVGFSWVRIWPIEHIQQFRCGRKSLVVVLCPNIVARCISVSIATRFLPLGVLEKDVYKNIPHTLQELRQNTELCISNVTAETL